VLASVYMLPCAQFDRPGKGLSCDIDLEDRCMHTSWLYVPNPPLKSSNIRFQKTFVFDLLMPFVCDDFMKETNVMEV
jgi:hypothetical protein